MCYKFRMWVLGFVLDFKAINITKLFNYSYSATIELLNSIAWTFIHHVSEFKDVFKYIIYAIASFLCAVYYE